MCAMTTHHPPFSFGFLKGKRGKGGRKAPLVDVIFREQTGHPRVEQKQLAVSRARYRDQGASHEISAAAGRYGVTSLPPSPPGNQSALVMDYRSRRGLWDIRSMRQLQGRRNTVNVFSCAGNRRGGPKVLTWRGMIRIKTGKL